MLNWDANLLYKTPIVAPKIIHGGRVCPTFNNMDDYYKVFKPFILMEVWAQVIIDDSGIIRRKEGRKEGRKEKS